MLLLSLPRALSFALTALPFTKAISIPFNSTKHGDGKNGAVASESSLCSNIGIDILKVGGNAADAVSLVRFPSVDALHIGPKKTSKYLRGYEYVDDGFRYTGLYFEINLRYQIHPKSRILFF